MNRWLLVRRARGPAFLMLVGVTALLNQWGVLSFSRSWPLYLILAGLLLLVERAVMPAVPPPPFPGQPYAQASGSAGGSGVVPSADSPSSMPTALPPPPNGGAHGENWRN
jgi:Domain of unknown function (DUF5668)